MLTGQTVFCKFVGAIGGVAITVVRVGTMEADEVGEELDGQAWSTWLA